MTSKYFLSYSPALLRGIFARSKITIHKLAHHEYIQATASTPLHDDHYVVSFPKSGATWMNFLMANVHLIMSGDRRRATFFNIHTLIPDIHITRDIRQPLLFPGFRVAKSHSKINPYYKNVIYLIRDPIDTMISYWNYLMSFEGYKGDRSSVIYSKVFGVSLLQTL